MLSFLPSHFTIHLVLFSKVRDQTNIILSKLDMTYSYYPEAFPVPHRGYWPAGPQAQPSDAPPSTVGTTA